MSGDALAQRTLDAVFAQWGKAASYTPTGGEAREITVLLSSPDLMVAPVGIAQRAESPRIEMRVSEVAAPRTGDGLVIGDQSYKLSTPRHPDKRRLKWAVELNRA